MTECERIELQHKTSAETSIMLPGSAIDSLVRLRIRGMRRLERKKVRVKLVDVDFALNARYMRRCTISIR